MRLLISCFSMMLFVSAYAQTNPITFKAWHSVGNPDFANASYQQLVVNGSGIPYVAVEQGTYGSSTETLMSVVNGTWVPVGQAQFAANLFSGSLAINADSKTSTPYFAYTTFSSMSGGSVHVDHLAGGKIVPVGADVTQSGFSGVHALAVSQKSIPYIFYYGSDGKGHVKAFENGVWADVGAPISVNYRSPTEFEQATNLSMMIGHDGTLYVWWYVHGQITLMKYIDGNWVQDGDKLGVSDAGIDADMVAVTVGLNGNVYVAQSVDSDMNYPGIYQLDASGKWTLLAEFTGYINDLGYQSLAVSNTGVLYYTFDANWWNGSKTHYQGGPGGVYTAAFIAGKWVFIGNRLGNRETQFLNTVISAKNQPMMCYMTNLAQIQVKAF